METEMKKMTLADELLSAVCAEGDALVSSGLLARAAAALEAKDEALRDALEFFTGAPVPAPENQTPGGALREFNLALVLAEALRSGQEGGAS